MITDLIKERGFAVLRNVISSKQLDLTRSIIMKNLNLFKNTRSYSSARHLASFHLHSSMSPLMTLAQHLPIKIILSKLLGDYIFLDFSDITVNRSQQWHKDLLRGKYTRYYENKNNICRNFHGHVYKVLIYLQDQSSLKVIKNSHVKDVNLNSDQFAIPKLNDEVIDVNSKQGDVVILDICSNHAGSTDEECRKLNLLGGKDTKILVSFTFGKKSSWLSNVMMVGNQARLQDWNEESDPVNFSR